MIFSLLSITYWYLGSKTMFQTSFEQFLLGKLIKLYGLNVTLAGLSATSVWQTERLTHTHTQIHIHYSRYALFSLHIFICAYKIDKANKTRKFQLLANCFTVAGIFSFSSYFHYAFPMLWTRFQFLNPIYLCNTQCSVPIPIRIPYMYVYMRRMPHSTASTRTNTNTNTNEKANTKRK